MMSFSDRSEIAFFDVETTFPTGLSILEFGAILVCPKRLIELEGYSTLVRPDDLSLISNLRRRNGITRDAVVSAPTFAEIADKVYDILHGRIWAGHNILGFDCDRIIEAFSAIKRPAPAPRGIIDTLPLLRQPFGGRAGDMKMATLAEYFAIGQQTHRSLDDVRMNLEVLKCCATVLFLELSLASSMTNVNTPYMVQPNFARPLDMRLLTSEIERRPAQSELLHSEGYSGCSSSWVDFLDPEAISIPSVSVILAPSYGWTQKIQILYNNVALQVCCRKLKVRFGINTRFVDTAGRPRLSFVVDASPSLCRILDNFDNLAQQLSMDSGSSSEWRPSVTYYGYYNSPTVRLHIPTITDGDTLRGDTEIYQEESSSVQRRVFSKLDITELVSLFTPGKSCDAYFSVDAYDYQQNAGIRLVAKKLVLHPNGEMRDWALHSAYI